MGRGKVELRRIENKISRQVAFSKRRSGLIKKAREISVLCDVEVAAVVFSTKGKLYEFSTDSGMERILERYEQYLYADKEQLASDTGSQEIETRKLKNKIEFLQKTQSNYMGEDLDSLSTKELQHLAQQLETGLKQVRIRKHHLLLEKIYDLKKKEKTLEEERNKLEKKLEMEELVSLSTPSKHQNNTTSNSSSLSPAISNTVPPPITGANEANDDVAAEGQVRRNLLPHWLLPHMNGLKS